MGRAAATHPICHRGAGCPHGHHHLGLACAQCGSSPLAPSRRWAPRHSGPAESRWWGWGWPPPPRRRRPHTPRTAECTAASSPHPWRGSSPRGNPFAASGDSAARRIRGRDSILGRQGQRGLGSWLRDFPTSPWGGSGSRRSAAHVTARVNATERGSLVPSRARAGGGRHRNVVASFQVGVLTVESC